MNIAAIIVHRSASDIITCEGHEKVREVVERLAKKRIGALPVMDAGKVVGIFSERDVIYRIAHEGEACLDRRIADVMTAPAITVEPATLIDDALARMTRRRIRHLPVLDGEALAGFVSIGDLIKTRIDEVVHEAEAMRQYITTG